MKWVYIAVGILVIYYVGQIVELYVTINSNEEVQVIRSGVQP